jgi:hypothetical protein
LTAAQRVEPAGLVGSAEHWYLVGSVGSLEA